MEGRCACGEVRYRLLAEPFVVHCCHCRSCQRETGSAFVINAIVETANVEVAHGEPQTIDTPSDSGKGQKIVRCPTCEVALWSHYAGAGDKAAFIRAGTLDDPDACPPDVHIFTRSKLPWVTLPEEVPAFEVFYSREDLPRIYGEDGAGRWRTLREG